MFVPEKNKLNKFKLVKLPKPCDMFARFGQMDTPSSQFTGDEVAVMASRKIDSLADMEEYDRYMQREELKKSVE